MLAGLAATLAFVGAARADGMPEPEPVASAPVYVTPVRLPWTGFYVGAHAGYGWTHVDEVSPAVPMGPATGAGPLVGGHAGYNWQHHRFVMGIEVDGTATWLRTDSGSCAPTLLNCSADYNWLASLRGRAGVVFNDQITLLYGTAGVAWTGVDYTIRDFVTGLPVGGFSEQHVGWVARSRH